MDSMSKSTPRADASDDEIVVLGVASTDTHGGPLAGEEMGGFTTLGISQE